MINEMEKASFASSRYYGFSRMTHTSDLMQFFDLEKANTLVFFVWKAFVVLVGTYTFVFINFACNVKRLSWLFSTKNSFFLRNCLAYARPNFLSCIQVSPQCEVEQSIM